ncbi:MAG TPA: NUDIX domain-containing protein [Solirubrobacteraceae bacterium]|nr:NUDIX domain-containing protein [Solirubrobacteraceae bacterium]
MQSPRRRDSVRVLLLDECDRLLLFRGEQPDSGTAFWFPPGGGLEPGEDVRAAAEREVREETGLAGVPLGPEVWRRRHVFTWRGVAWDQRERWFVARVARFRPDGAGLAAAERADLTAWRWWTVEELAAAEDELVPRDLAARLRALLAEGPPPAPIDVGV